LEVLIQKEKYLMPAVHFLGAGLESLTRFVGRGADEKYLKWKWRD